MERKGKGKGEVSLFRITLSYKLTTVFSKFKFYKYGIEYTISLDFVLLLARTLKLLDLGVCYPCDDVS